MSRRPDRIILLGLAALAVLVPLGCGGGGGGGGGDGGGGGGEATLVKQVSTPLGAQGNLGDWSAPANAYVDVLYNLADKEYSRVDVKIEYAVDWNDDGLVTADEWRPATSAPGLGDGTEGLKTSPGSGSRHKFVWDSVADIGSERFVTVDFRYDASGRVVIDGVTGLPVYESYPGARIRITVLDADGAVRETSPFDISNNTLPVIAPDVRVDGIAEGVKIYYKPVDANGDLVSISVDYSTDLGNTWQKATPTAGTVISNVPTSTTEAGAVEQLFTWDTVADLGTVRVDDVLVRVKPFDSKGEHGDALECPATFVVENWEIFTDAGSSLGTARVDHRATTLKNDLVLISGGRTIPGGAALQTAELFYPTLGPTTTGTFAETAGAMTTARADHVAVRLYDGRVLLAGGTGFSGALSSAEIYDPSTNTFASTGAMSAARSGAAAVLLVSGKVLVAGGVDGSGLPTASSDIYDPSTGTWTSGPSMNTARTNIDASVLGDGRVLIPGGMDASSAALGTAELYDPWTDTFLATVDLDEARFDHAVVSLRDGRVLVAGGMASPPKTSLETFDPDTDAFTTMDAALTTARSSLGAADLSDGRVLLFGGLDASLNVLDTAERWDPATDVMDEPKGDLQTRRAGAAISVLRNGRPVAFGGLVGSTTATTATDIYTPAGGSNALPVAEITTPSTPEFPSLGVRIHYVLKDAEGDPVRIRVLYSMDSGSTFHPATPRPTTILGDMNDGTDGLAASADGVEHLFIWAMKMDVGAVDSTSARVRIIPYGSEEGTIAETSNFETKKNFPVIARMDALSGDQFGAIDLDFTLLDIDGDTAYLQKPDSSSAIEYGVDLNADGQILEEDGESWNPATPVAGSIDDTTALATLTVSEEAVEHRFTWDSVRDIGAPRTGRSDIVFRLWAHDADPGIYDTLASFSIITDPNGQFLVSWHPEGQSALSPTQTYSGSVERDRPIVFNFNADVASGTATDETIQVSASQTVDGYYHVSGKTVTWYPQVPDDRGLVTMSSSTSYTVHVQGYDPSTPTLPTVEKAGGSTGDYNSLVCLLTDTRANAFTTGSGYVNRGGNPSVIDLDPLPTATGVATGKTIEVTVDTTLDPSTCVYPNLQAVVLGGAVDSVIPGDITVMNFVGPDGVRHAVISFDPVLDLPYGTTIQLVFGSGVKDLYGNTASSASSTFVVETGTAAALSHSISFTSTSNSNTDLTNAYWGTKTYGRLTGLDDGGTGSDGALTVSGYTTRSGTTYNYSSLTVNAGSTLQFNGSSATTVYIKGDAVINGVVDASGQPGETTWQDYYYSSGTPPSSYLTYAGGAGGPGGGKGGTNSTYLPTSSGTYVYQTGGNGSGSGGGTGAYTTSGYYGSGGGGGGYGTAGSAGDTYSTYYGSGGKGGSTYGSASLSTKPGGSGGGAGSGSIYYGGSYYYLFVGCGAGGGGGSLTIICNGKLTIGSAGAINVKGGKGGVSYFYSGGGGGGSGGDLHIKAGGGVTIDGKIDVGGGAGGGPNSYSSYANNGGEGGKGRLRIEEPNPPSTLLRYDGEMAIGINTGITDGGALAGNDGKFTPTSNTSLTTSSSKSTWYFSEIDIPSGVTVTIKGDRVARLLSSGDVTVAGLLLLEGGRGNNGTYSSGTSGNFGTSVGGTAGPGGKVGGRSHTIANTTTVTDGEDGNGTGAGKGGKYAGPYYTSSYTYWYYAGSGGGASYGTSGTDGSNYVNATSYYKAGAGGKAGSTYGSSSTLTHTNLDGGSSGGGGANARYWYGTSGSFYGSGSGGGSPGGVTVETPKKFTLSGEIRVQGGAGGYGYSTPSGGGGGASGGDAVLRGGEWNIPLGYVNLGGGIGGQSYSYYTYTYYGWGGFGGGGRFKMEAPEALSITAASIMITGSLSTDVFAGKNTGVSIWFDAGGLSPDYSALTSVVYPSDGSQTEISIEVAQSDPATGDVDESTLVRLTPAEIAAGDGDGYRYYRFVAKLISGSFDPYVDSITITGTK